MHKAEETRLLLRKLQKDYLIDMEDAIVAAKEEPGRVKLHDWPLLVPSAERRVWRKPSDRNGRNMRISVAQ